MRIGIDARTILNPEKGEAIGVGHYTYQLIRHLLEADNENQYVLFFDWRAREKDIKKFTRPNVKIRFYPFSDYRKYLPGAYNEILGRATLAKEDLDVLHSTSYQSRIPLGYRGKTVATFHDLGMYTVPECYSRATRVRGRAVILFMARKADRIIAVSQSIKDDLVQKIKVSQDKIKVIYSGIDKRFFDNPADSSNKILEKFGITKKYLLFLGTLEPSKNITRLFESFAKFRERRCGNTRSDNSENGNECDYQLVVAGKRGWLSQQYPRIVKDLGIHKDVVFTGYVVGDELVPLFRNAQFFIMPSLYEGFGMTVLEAFATQTPAIVSRVSSLPELAQNAAFYVNPMDVDGMVAAMEKFAEEENIRKEFSERGFIQAKKFNWEKTAQETLAVYRSLVG